MVSRGGCVLVVVELQRGTEVAVVWDGGPFATVHALVDGRPADALERWSMHDPRTGRAAIDATPEALERLTAFRLSDVPAARRLTRLARSVIAELAPV